MKRSDAIEKILKFKCHKMVKTLTSPTPEEILDFVENELEMMPPQHPNEDDRCYHCETTHPLYEWEDEDE